MLNALMCACVQIGDVPVGSDHRIALQTMTTTDTRDIDGTVDQARHGVAPQSQPSTQCLAVCHTAIVACASLCLSTI